MVDGRVFRNLHHQGLAALFKFDVGKKASRKQRFEGDVDPLWAKGFAGLNGNIGQHRSRLDALIAFYRHTRDDLRGRNFADVSNLLGKGHRAIARTCCKCSSAANQQTFN